MYSQLLQLSEKESQAKAFEIATEWDDESIMNFVEEAKLWQRQHDSRNVDFHGRPYNEKAMVAINLFETLDTAEGIKAIRMMDAVTGRNLLCKLVAATIATDWMRIHE